MTVKCCIKDGTIDVQITEYGCLIYDMILVGTADYIEVMEIHERLRDMATSPIKVSEN